MTNFQLNQLSPQGDRRLIGVLLSTAMVLIVVSYLYRVLITNSGYDAPTYAPVGQIAADRSSQ